KRVVTRAVSPEVGGANIHSSIRGCFSFLIEFRVPGLWPSSQKETRNRRGSRDESRPKSNQVQCFLPSLTADERACYCGAHYSSASANFLAKKVMSVSPFRVEGDNETYGSMCVGWAAGCCVGGSYGLGASDHCSNQRYRQGSKWRSSAGR